MVNFLVPRAEKVAQKHCTCVCTRICVFVGAVLQKIWTFRFFWACAQQSAGRCARASQFSALLCAQRDHSPEKLNFRVLARMHTWQTAGQHTCAHRFLAANQKIICNLTYCILCYRICLFFSTCWLCCTHERNIGKHGSCWSISSIPSTIEICFAVWKAAWIYQVLLLHMQTQFSLHYKEMITLKEFHSMTEKHSTWTTCWPDKDIFASTLHKIQTDENFCVNGEQRRWQFLLFKTCFQE